MSDLIKAKGTVEVRSLTIRKLTVGYTMYVSYTWTPTELEECAFLVPESINKEEERAFSTEAELATELANWLRGMNINTQTT